MKNAEQVEDLTPWGYAPGYYTLRCIDCPPEVTAKQWGMAAKRAWRCEEHARAARDSAAMTTPNVEQNAGDGVSGENHWQGIEDWLTEVIADSFYAHWDAIDGARAIVARIRAGDFPGLVAPLPVRATECPSSHDGRCHVDTSMESGPNNCFHCERPM